MQTSMQIKIAGFGGNATQKSSIHNGFKITHELRGGEAWRNLRRNPLTIASSSEEVDCSQFGAQEWRD